MEDPKPRKRRTRDEIDAERADRLAQDVARLPYLDLLRFADGLDDNIAAIIVERRKGGE